MEAAGASNASGRGGVRERVRRAWPSGEGATDEGGRAVDGKRARAAVDGRASGRGHAAAGEPTREVSSGQPCAAT